MPTRAPLACPRPGCRLAKPCPEHAPASWSGGAHGRAMPRGWAATRARILRRDGHRCRRCGAPALIADHIDRHGGEQDENLQALCQPCSDTKTQAEAAAARAGRG